MISINKNIEIISRLKGLKPSIISHCFFFVLSSLRFVFFESSLERNSIVSIIHNINHKIYCYVKKIFTHYAANGAVCTMGGECSDMRTTNFFKLGCS